MASVILIYGFSLEKNEEIKVKKGSKMYYIPFYGKKDCEDLRYVGIEFGTVESPFDNPFYDSKSLQITKLKPSESTINKMKSLYDKKNLKCHALIQDVYTSHYVAGSIYCGYWINNLNKSKELDSEKLKDHIISSNIGDYSCVDISHNLTDAISATCFVGTQLSNNFVPFEFNDEDEPGHNFYKMLTKKYKKNLLKIKFTNDIMTSNLCIAFVPKMCHCCT